MEHHSNYFSAERRSGFKCCTAGTQCPSGKGREMSVEERGSKMNEDGKEV